VARFREKKRQYGSVDCVKSTVFVLRKAGVKIPFLKGKTYGSRATAKAILEQTGCATLVDCMDALGLTRIAPLATLPGDIIALPVPEGDPFGASLLIVHTAGAHRVFGFDPQDSRFRVGVPELAACLAAWRVPHG
jgi:hypothetical protein